MNIPMRFRREFLVLVLALLAFTPASRAATITWTNTSGGNWNTAANWSPNQMPGLNDTAVIVANGTYTVTLDSNDAPPVEIVALQQPSPFVQTAPVESLDVTFSSSIEPATFAVDDLLFFRNRQQIAPGSELSIQPLSGSRYRISGLTPFTSDDGSYELTVSGIGVFDPAGAAVANNITVNWAKGTVAPVVASLGPVTLPCGRHPSHP